VRPADLPAYVRDTVLRMLPHRAATGLFPVGAPTRTSPVLVTGNFTLTVRRLRDALGDRNVWLLVADSRGINVWCASSGGHFTHHSIIAAIRATGLAGRVDHREIVLPQLCATGVERRRITETTGFSTRWGPARLEDIPAFLDRGARIHERDRFMRFPVWERLEMAAMWALPMLCIAGPVLALLFGGVTALAAGLALIGMVFGLFALLPRLAVQGRRRFLTFAGAVAAAWLLGGGLLLAVDGATVAHLEAVAAVCLAAMAMLSVDLAGTTPWYDSYVNAFLNPVRIELVPGRCTGAAECVQVCPRDVLKMDGRRRLVEIVHPDQCIRCGACVVQCPEDALRFRADDGGVIEAPTIRATRMNLLGRRTIRVP
jgi:NAD-dependent dihydropyrimidine dehydrogenase PreA subunit